MIQFLISRLVKTPPDGSAEAALSFEGMRVDWALLIFAVLAVLAFIAYRWGAPEMSKGRRTVLAALRILLVGLFLLLLVKPVLLVTLNEPVRERLLVVVDTTQSMEIKDRRRAEDDQKRAALAAGLLLPKPRLDQPMPAGAGKWQDVSRGELLRALAANDKLKLWPRLQEKADLAFFSMGREAHPLGPVSGSSESDTTLSLDQAKAIFDRITYPEPVTAIGDSLRQLLNENRGQPIAGILLITDGANNTGAPPEEIAQMAKEDGIPLYLYGVGITTPKDITVRNLAGPRAGFVKERVDFTVKVSAPGFSDRTVKIKLKANGKTVDEKELKLSGAGEMEVPLGYEPQEKGEAQIEAAIDPLEEESARDNNSATTKLRILDSKVKVLYIEGEPRWDFRYLLSTLQNDRRLSVKCFLVHGDPETGEDPKSPFLPEFPAERADLLSNEIIVLGDVDPEVLGPTRMKLLNEWVSETGGGLIFLAGPKNNPFRYGGTPLEALLPVELAAGLTEQQWSTRSRSLIRLKLMPTGEQSSLLKLSDKPLENRQLWNAFTGVHWTARVSRARPTAQVFLTDTTPDKANRDGLMPVIAQQQYGHGMVMYFGFDETYRWRSEIGGKFYERIWNQVIQSFSLERQLGASARTQLQVEKPEYLAGDKVVISGKIYTEKFTPLIEPSVPGILSVTGEDGKADTAELRLLAVHDQPGEYQVEFTPRFAGVYRFSPNSDKAAVVKFEVFAPKIEQSETAMNGALLQTMARISGGKFLREEELDSLPELLASRSATLPSQKTIELYYSAWWMGAMMALAVLEWLLRRLWQLK